MSTDITVPQLPESVSDATVANWSKKKGDSVQRDEVLVELETDKVVLEVPAPADGVLEEILEDEGAVVTADAVLGRVAEGATASGDEGESEGGEESGEEEGRESQKEKEQEKEEEQAESAGAAQSAEKDESEQEARMGPAARKLIAEHGLDPNAIEGSGKDGRITKEDVLKHIDEGGKSGRAQEPAEAKREEREPQPETRGRDEGQAESRAGAPSPQETAQKAGVSFDSGERPEKRVPMTRLRARIAERLVQATQQTAMLTTFNEVNMEPIMKLRSRYKDQFEKTHGTKLGFMSFFVTAAAEALKRFPDINASIDDTDIVYHGYCDIGIAVSSERGLVVPILRDAETLPMADIERQIRDFGARAQEGKIGIDEMTGGTFTITNGGVFGSLVSTPILNMPQSAILGMHAIQERPVAVDGEVVIRPMMYLALSYDHRIVDGKDSVQFLVAIKQLLEDPARLLLDI